MEETLFYVLGITLVVAALSVSVIGLRWEGFPPSRAVLGVVIAGFAALVVATGAFAWMNAANEQDDREAEQAEEAAQAPAQEGGGGETTTTTTASVSGEEVFNSAGCSGCHTLSAAGSTGTTGPNLDDALKGKPSDFIEQSIVDPNAVIAEGYPPDVMPQNFGDSLSPEELDAVVQYLSESTQ
jgi:mono/diheme cytochrome c family protein